MVPLYNVYRFTAQMVDTIDDISVTAVTNHNKLLIAQPDYTIEVKDLLSDTKISLFSFPTVDRVRYLTHCATGNYVATLEGKHANQKTDTVFVRIYTNWEADFIVDKFKKPNKNIKRIMRARIAGVVTPSSIKTEDYLDMIEFPTPYSASTLLTCCQMTGNILIANGSTFYYFKQTYSTGSNGKGPSFMDFFLLNHTFKINFIPTSISVIDCFISANNHRMVTVFMFSRCDANDTPRKFRPKMIKTASTVENDSTSIITEKGALNLNNIINKLKQFDHDQTIFKTFSEESYPYTLIIKGVNDRACSKVSKCPFIVYPLQHRKKLETNIYQDNFVETYNLESNYDTKAECLLAMELNDSCEIITKTAMHLWSDSFVNFPKCSGYYSKRALYPNRKISSCLHFLVSTNQEGYLFFTDEFQYGLECVCVYNFTSPVLGITFHSDFMLALTELGIEIYNLPTLRPLIFENNVNLVTCMKWVTILGLQSFLGVSNFIQSDDCITVFSSAEKDEDTKKKIPWTMYTLKVPKIYEVYEEIIQTCSTIDMQQDEARINLLTEAYLMLYLYFERHPLPSDNTVPQSIQENFIANSLNLVKLYFESKIEDHIRVGIKIMITSKLNIFELINMLNNEDKSLNHSISQLLDIWIDENHESLDLETKLRIIQLYQEVEQIPKLAEFLLSDEEFCREYGHKAIAGLKNYVNNLQEKSDINVLFILCILCTLQCSYSQDDASEVLAIVQKHEELAKSFINLAFANWNYLFDSGSEKKTFDFSEFTSVLIENLPLETAKLFRSVLGKTKDLNVQVVVQALLKKLPCQISIEKGQLVLQSFLENVFALKLNSVEQNIKAKLDEAVHSNCSKMLMRSYIIQLRTKDIKPDDPLVASYKPIFNQSLPSYLNMFPIVDNCNYFALRKLQDLLWSNVVKAEDVAEIMDTLPNSELKINVSAVLRNGDFVRDLMRNNYLELIIPYVKEAVTDVKPWTDILISIKNRIKELKYSDQDDNSLEEIYNHLLEHLPLVMKPQNIHSILEPIMSQNEVYWKCMVRSQQIMSAQDIKELVIQSSLQILQNN